jgi:hypothetical protein
MAATTIDPNSGALSGTYQASPTSSNITQTTIPEWAAPYMASALQRAYNLSYEGYQPYAGQMYAGINPMQQQSWNNLYGMGTSPLTGQAAGLAGLAGTTSLTAGQNYANQITNPFAVQSYMSPYAQNVVDTQKQQAISDYGRQLPTLGANAARVGGLGGTRSALMQSEAQRNLGNQLQGIQATGLQNAYQSAMQNMQNATNFGLQGYGQALNAANIMGGLGQQQVQQALDINKAQQAAGADIRAIEQQPLSAQYQQFLDEKNLPYKQISFMSDILRGTPLAGSSASSTYAAPPSTLGQLTGLGIGLGSLLKNG